MSPVPSNPIDRREKAMRFLYDRIDYERVVSIPYKERDFKLDRMRILAQRLGNPHLAVPVVHIGGTKGKGSTVSVIRSVLSAAGYRTGAYTSPHLERIEERIAIDGQPCSAEQFVELVLRIAPIVEEMDREAASLDPPERGLTYFEITTAMAMLHFASQKVDVAVLEVGLGGRLDSTNICQPAVSVITSISFDHTKQLGNTLEAIAWEKAGIVKPGVPVVSGVVHPYPSGVIRRICRERDSRLIERGIDFHFQYRPPDRLESTASIGHFDFRDETGGGYKNLPLCLTGRHQAANAAVALATLGTLRNQGWDLSEASVRQGLSDVPSSARVELLARHPAVVLDTAHNLASIESLLEVLRESFQVNRQILVFAASMEKDTQGMIARLAHHFDWAIITQYLNNLRAVPAEQLIDSYRSSLAHNGKNFGNILDGSGSSGLGIDPTHPDRPVEMAPSPSAAWQRVHELAKPDDLVCITGSFFLAAEMRAEIRRSPIGEPESDDTD